MKKIFWYIIVVGILLLLGLFYVVKRSAEEDHLQEENKLTVVQENIVSSDEMLAVQKASESEDKKQVKELIYVHVCGAVKKPGVYGFLPGSRVTDAIKAAGGHKKSADTNGVNQASLLFDGDQIYIPKMGEEKVPVFSTLKEEEKSGLIDLNRATKEELMTLPGIGEAKADLILLYREKNGEFMMIEDIMNVNGIKDGSFQKIKNYIFVK